MVPRPRDRDPEGNPAVSDTELEPPKYDNVENLRVLRETLLNAGYRHANKAGELVSADGTTWVGTTYTHGEYSLYAWRRPTGIGNATEPRFVIRVTPITNPSVLDDATKRLKLWAKKPRKNAVWPPVGFSPVRVGQ